MPKNNFDFLRLLFASFVIITHSYRLTGIREGDILFQLTHGQVLFSDLGVKGFFIISGYLIFQSLERSPNLINYYWKRVLRLFPALLVVLVVTVLLAPLIYNNPKTPYLLNTRVWTYIPRNLTLYKLQTNIIGIFETNPFKSVINGSLWTIPYEFTMYMLVSLLFFVRKRTLILSLSFVGLMALNLFCFEKFDSYTFLLNGGNFLDLSIFFVAGSLLASLKMNNNRIYTLLFILCVLLFPLSLKTMSFGVLKFIILPIIVIFIGNLSTPIFNSMGEKVGDLSYGVYIYGFPIQQTLIYCLNPDYLTLMFFTFPISLFFGYLSWHFVEKRALKLKAISPKVYLQKIRILQN